MKKTNLKCKMFFFKLQYIIMIVFMRPKITYYNKDTKKTIKNSKTPFIIAYNHVGYYDAILLCSVFWTKYIRLIATDEIIKNRISKFFFSWNGVITINRENFSLADYSKVRKSLAAGFWIGIAPEGHINRTKQLLEFQLGAAQIAIASKTQIIPIYIAPKRKILWQRQLIYIADPLLPTGDKIELTNTLKQKISELSEICQKSIKTKSKKSPQANSATPVF